MSLDSYSKMVFNETKRWLFNVWCFLCLYALGAYYMPIEFNRKWGLLFDVRKLDPEKDLPSSLEDSTCVITGGSRGIGWEAAKILLRKGCHVIVASSVKPGDPLKQLIEKLSNELDSNLCKNLEIWHLDLSSMRSIEEFVARLKSSGLPVNVLINNAGLMYAPFRLTEDKLESHLAINYLGHCLLVAHLLPLLEKSAQKAGVNSRIVNVSSSTHFARNLDLQDLNGLQMYSPFHAYAQSKLAQVMFTYRLHELLSSKTRYQRVTVNCLHPGVAKTELYEHVWWVKAFPLVADNLFRTAEEGAETVVFAAYSCELEGVGGKYLEDCCLLKSSGYSYNRQHQEELWRQTWTFLEPWTAQTGLSDISTREEKVN